MNNQHRFTVAAELLTRLARLEETRTALVNTSSPTTEINVNQDIFATVDSNVALDAIERQIAADIQLLSEEYHIVIGEFA